MGQRGIDSPGGKAEKIKVTLIAMAAAAGIYLLQYALLSGNAGMIERLFAMLAIAALVIAAAFLFLFKETNFTKACVRFVKQWKPRAWFWLWLLLCALPAGCGAIYFCRAAHRTAAVCTAAAGLIMLLAYLGFSHVSCARWCAGRDETLVFLQAEHALQGARWAGYLTAVAFAALPAACRALWRVPEFTWCALFTGLLLICTLSQGLFRSTFRRVAGWCVAAGAGLMYCVWVMASQQCPPELQAIRDSLEQWPLKKAALDVLSGSLVLTAVAAVVRELLSGVWRAHRPGAEDRETWRTRLRKGRLDLLQHRWYREHNLFSSFNRSALVIGTSCAAFAVLTFLYITGRAEQERAAYLLELLLACVALMLLGCTLYFTSGNGSLLQAEYYYLCHAGPKLKPEEINGGAPRWLDFCQVFAHLYNSRVDVASEDKLLHTLKTVIRKTADYQEARGICKTYFYAELLRSWEEIRFKDEAQSGGNDSSGGSENDSPGGNENNSSDGSGNDSSGGGRREDYTEYPLAVHLARTVPAGFLQDAAEGPLQRDSGFAHILALARKCYFQADNGVSIWEKCRSFTSLNREDFQYLVILDIWLGQLRRLPASGGCPMAPVCNELHSGSCPLGMDLDKQEGPVGKRKAACAGFLLLFPMLAAEAMLQRYGNRLTDEDKGLFQNAAGEYGNAIANQCKDFLNSSSKTGFDNLDVHYACLQGYHKNTLEKNIWKNLWNEEINGIRNATPNSSAAKNLMRFLLDAEAAEFPLYLQDEQAKDKSDKDVFNFIENLFNH